MNIAVTKKNSGFTIVELLVVVVVIAILAAITIVSYNGIKNRAIASSLQSDLSQNITTIENYATLNSGQYPGSPTTATSNGVKSSNNNLSYRWTGGNSYCLMVSDTGNTNSYYATNSNASPQKGTCPPVVNTFAGSLTSGSADGTGIAAQFKLVSGLAIDSSNTLYVSDVNDNKIRKITSSGVVTTLAGSGTAGFLDATGASAQFSAPTGIAVDSSGTVYVADRNNNRIRKITPAGVVTTLAGSGTAGFADANGTSAQFNQPSGVAVDSSGNVFVSDTLNYRVRKITSAGVATTYAGTGVNGYLDGAAASAKFRIALAGLVIDGSGNLYVNEFSHVRKITPGGTVSTFTGAGGEVAGPIGIAIDKSGNFIIGDSQLITIIRATPAGVVTTLAGDGNQAVVDGLNTSVEFNAPQGIAVDSIGNIYISDASRIAQMQL